ncbi:unnamed protein product [Urochloa humidicola]
MSFQRPKSILTGGLGWWILRLYHVLESSDGGFGGLCFDFASAVGGSKMLLTNRTLEVSRKMNRSPRDFFVIFFSFEVLFVIVGMYCAVL